MFEDDFKRALSKYVFKAEQISASWQEIVSNYGQSKRYYHNLNHLDEMYKELVSVQAHIKDWDCIIFSIAWHDMSYNVMKKDNEEKSAAFAEKKLKEFCFQPILLRNAAGKY